jgi:ABC-type sugar transport system ATPase subunit
MIQETNVLEMRHITKLFPGVRALSEVDFALRKREIHALLGENGAGKSTLMKVLIGHYKEDAGEIYFEGNKVKIDAPQDALGIGISMIHQETTLINTMTVSENIWLGREKKFLRCGLISARMRNAATQKILTQLKLIAVKPTDLVQGLSAANKQMVELARAISYDAKIVIMDEPTSSLSDYEINVLYETCRDLVKKDISVIFISHKLNEIFDICDRVTIMRDGRHILTCDTSEADEQMLIKHIAGREINNLYPSKSNCIGDVTIHVDQLCSAKVFENISFEGHAGEVLGFCGLVGAGRTELMYAIFGRNPYDKGKIEIYGKKCTIKSPRDATRHDLAMVTEDRLATGIMKNLSVRENVGLARLPHFVSKFKLLSSKKELTAVSNSMQALRVKFSTLEQAMGSLSGGNQQKAIIARWMLTVPNIFILDEPTRGIDVGAKSEIHKLIRELADQGKTVLLISSELPEVLGLSDRVLVMRDGRIVGEFDEKTATQETLTQCMFGI